MYDAGKILAGLAVFGALVTGPIWYGIGKGTGGLPELQKPAGEKQCIEPTAFMRARHMELLDQWRLAVVRVADRVYVASDGKRHDMSLTRTCLRCHADERVKGHDGKSLFVRTAELSTSRHAKVACSQCHSQVNASRVRPCETITQEVDCSSCHDEIGRQYLSSTHGRLLTRKDPNAPSCKECHGNHGVLGRLDPHSPTFSTNVPTLCARCHREGQKAAVRYIGRQHAIIEHYTERIHGQGLLQSG